MLPSHLTLERRRLATLWARLTARLQARRHACFPLATGQPCPVAHKKWLEGGCVSTLPTSCGTRIRNQLDRESEQYLRLYAQRTTTERISSQAKELGIERPKLR